MVNCKLPSVKAKKITKIEDFILYKRFLILNPIRLITISPIIYANGWRKHVLVTDDNIYNDCGLG